MDALSKVLNGSSIFQPKVKTQSQAGFDMFFATVAEQRTPVETTDSTARHNQSGNRNGNDDNSRGRDSRVDRADNATRNNLRTRSNSAQETEATTGGACVEQTTNMPVETAVDEQEAIVAIAAILQLPVEEVVALLDELNMEVSDLTEPKMVSKFLQLALGAETAADLLKDPNFPEMFKAINEKMAELVIEAETTVISGKVVDLSAQILQAAETLQVADIEGLQVSLEDGQVVVTDESTTTTNTTETTTTQATVNTEQELAQTALKHSEGEGLKMADVEAPLQEQPVTTAMVDSNAPKTVAQEIIKNATPTPQVDAVKVI